MVHVVSCAVWLMVGVGVGTCRASVPLFNVKSACVTIIPVVEPFLGVGWRVTSVGSVRSIEGGTWWRDIARVGKGRCCGGVRVSSSTSTSSTPHGSAPCSSTSVGIILWRGRCRWELCSAGGRDDVLRVCCGGGHVSSRCWCRLPWHRGCWRARGTSCVECQLLLRLHQFEAEGVDVFICCLMAGRVGELNGAEASGEGGLQRLDCYVVIVGGWLAMGVIGSVVPRGCCCAGARGEANCVRFDEVYFEVLPNLVGFQLGVPADEGTVVEARALDCADGFIDELWLGERRFCNKSGDETVLEAIKKRFDWVIGVPLRVECCLVRFLFCRSWAAI